MTAATEAPAEQLAARLKQDMPADIPACRYVVSGAYVQGQLTAGFHAESSARLLRIAEAFGLAYVATALDGDRLDLSARGVIDGVDVRFWDNVPVPASTAPCGCGCHRLAVSS